MRRGQMDQELTGQYSRMTRVKLRLKDTLAEAERQGVPDLAYEMLTGAMNAALEWHAWRRELQQEEFAE